MGPSARSRVASYSSREFASLASLATRPVSPVPPLAASMRQARSRYERSSSGSLRPPSSNSSSAAHRASAASRGSSTEGPPGELTGLLHVDAVLGDDHVQVVWGAPHEAPPLAVEDLGVASVGPEQDAFFYLVKDCGVL
jgi:hypothetical protein